MRSLGVSRVAVGLELRTEEDDWENYARMDELPERVPERIGYLRT
jgi:hypothetical protein